MKDNCKINRQRTQQIRQRLEEFEYGRLKEEERVQHKKTNSPVKCKGTKVKTKR